MCEVIVYRHKKTGNLYKFLYAGRHTETLEEMVVYQSKNGDIWIRPLSLFNEKFEKVEHGGNH